MNKQEYFAQEQARQNAREGVWNELASHLEHGPDSLILSDYTAVLLFGIPPEERDAALKEIRGQLYSRNSRDTGRVDSWFRDCCSRFQQDREGFLKQSEDEYLRGHHAEQKRKEKAARKTGKPRVRPACEFAPEQAEYLIEPYLPRGMVSILGGVSGAGKTSLALDVCARLTREGPRPVLYLTAENDPNKVLRPRAEAMGADLTKLYFQDGASYAMGDEELAGLCRELRPALVVFDPIQSYLGQGVQMNRAEQVRPLLDNLGALAKELDMAVLLISHMSKPGPGVCSALDRLLGSSDFRNAARSIVIVGKDPEHPDTRVFAHAKNSLGVPGGSQRYHIRDNGTVAYDGPCDLTADRIIQDVGAASARTRPAATLNAAVEALDQQLGFVGWVEYAEVERLCAKHGFSERTMRRAKTAMELKTVRIGQQPDQKFLWYRPELSKDAVLSDYKNQNTPLTFGDVSEVKAS